MIYVPTTPSNPAWYPNTMAFNYFPTLASHAKFFGPLSHSHWVSSARPLGQLLWREFSRRQMVALLDVDMVTAFLVREPAPPFGPSNKMSVCAGLLQACVSSSESPSQTSTSMSSLESLSCSLGQVIKVNLHQTYQRICSSGEILCIPFSLKKKKTRFT